MLNKLRTRIKEEYGSQAFFARKTGQDENSISRYLNGEVKMPVIKMFEWAKALNIPEGQLEEFFLEK